MGERQKRPIHIQHPTSKTPELQAEHIHRLGNKVTRTTIRKNPLGPNFPLGNHPEEKKNDPTCKLTSKKQKTES